jgi:uncharacterized repeat protein (TIGR01451 family)
MATTLKTNQRDYFPGETVTLTLGEFDPGSSFVFAVRDSASDPGDDGVANVYSPFWVTDGGWGDRDGLVNGQIVAQWVVPSDPDGSGPLVAPALHATLEVTASTASTSGTGGVVVASTTFTDANPTPVQLFYVPMPENQLLQALQAIDTGNSSPDPVNPMQTYISIAASNSGTWIYYDHWEDGYEADISNPTQATTRVWGDGNLANGVAPGTVNDLITAGTVLVLNNPVDTNNPLPTDYDGGDKFAASKTVAVTRVGWASGSDTLLAGSVEVLDTNNWGTSFRAPVGQNIPNTDSFQMFEYTGLFIQAGEGGAVINVDVNANGLVDAGDVVNVALAEGKSYLVNDGVNIGATVTSSKPVQVDILTGDIGSNYESRDSALLPTNLWSNNYYTPVSTQDANATTVWLYNPGATSINVTYTYRSNSTTTPSTTITVAANSYAKQVIPDGSGARFHTASGANFYAFSTTDSNSGQSDGGGNQAYDWGFTLIPQYSLTNQVLIGLGIGRDPTSGTNPNENGNPVWVTPIGNGNTPVNVYVDRNNDGVVDQTLSLRELERAKVFDPDGNQTGMRIYTDAPGVKLAAAWGQDPASASPGAPGLDVGTGVPPLPQFGAGKNGTLLVDADGGGQITAGDTLLYTITIPNISTVPVPDVKLQDILPADTTYISNSTKINRGDGLGFVSIPDAGTTPFPLDEGGAILGTIPVGKTYTVTFEARIDAFKDLDPGRIAIVNNGTVNALGETKPISDTTPLYFFTNIDIEKFTNGEDADTPTGPVLLVNSPVVWTYEVKTTGNVWLSGISVTDSVFGVNPVKVDANNDTFNDGDTNKDNILQTGETWLYQATGIATTIGQYTNTGTATGTPVYGNGTTVVPGLANPVVDTDPSHYFGADATIDVEKYVSIDGGANWVDADLATGPYLSSGTDPQFKFVVTNTGNVDLANVTLTDSDFNIDGADKSVSIGALAAGASYELIYADAAWAAGQHTDTATASGEYTDDNGDTTTPTDTDDANYFGSNATIDVEKYVSIDGGANWVDADLATGPYLSSGTDPQFKFVVTNTGNVDLANVTLTDSDFNIDGADKSVSIGALAAGASYELIYADAAWAAGQHTDTATASGEYTDDNGDTTTPTDTDDANYFGSNATIDVEKYVSIDGGANWVDADLATGPYLSSGTDPQFKFVVTNTGNVDLANVTLTDSDFNIDGADKSVSIGALAAGASYELIYADAAWAAGQHTDTATASGEYTDDNGDTTTPTDTDDANYFGSNATIDVEKYVSIDGGANWVDADLATGPYLSSGTDPQFKFVVTNTGNVDLANVTLTDSDFNIDGADKSVSIGALAAGASYELIYADAAWAAGQHTDTATASGEYTDDNGDTTTPTDTDDANYFGSNATIDVEKYVSIDGGANWVDADLATGPYLSSGTDPQFKFVVTNTGNVDLANVTLTDSDFNIDGADKSVSIGALAAGASYELIYADAAWAAGQHTDTATASGEYTDDNGDTTTPTDTDDANYFGSNATIDVEKYVSIDGGANWVDADLATGPYLSSGTDPQFKFVVTNTGNVDLANVTLTDSDFNIDGADKSVSIGALAAGASYELIYADAAWAAGQHTDTATASGEYTDDNGDTTTPTDTDDANYFGSNATIDVEKYVSIDGGANWVDADLATGPYLSSGTDPQFKFVVTNTGNVDLANVTLTDSDFNIDGADKSVSIGALAAGASYELIYADAAWAAGQHTDTATASGEYTDDNGDTTTPTDTDDANYFGSNATIDVEKYVSIDGGANWVDADLATGPYLSSGTDPQFKFVVTNTGNVDLANVTLTDSDFNIDGADKSVSIGALAAGASYELIYADAAWAAGQHTDTATASGEYTDDNGDTTTPTDTDDANYFGSNATIDVEKYVSIDGGANWVDADLATGPYLSSGTDPQFKFVVTNTGDVDLANVTLTDSDFNIDGADKSVSIGALAAGASYELIYADAAWAAGQHTDTATASGEYTDDNGDTTTPTDTDDANYFGSNATIDVEKYVSIDGGANWVDADLATGPYLSSGTDPQFKFVVTNTGNVDLANVTLTDSDFNIDGADKSVSIGALAAGASYELIYADAAWAAGQHTDTATASGEYTDDNGDTTTPTDTDDANYFGSNATIDVEKYVSIDGGANWVDADLATGPYLSSGTDPQFKFVVTNTGNVDLANVTLTDSDFNIDGADKSVSIGALAAGASYELIYADAAWAAGQHTDTATASGEYTDDNGDTTTPTDTDDANYFGSNATIDVEKYVSIDGGANWVDADLATGPYLSSGTDPQFKFVVTNTGNVDLANVTLTDSDFNIDGADKSVSIGALAAGASYELIYADAAWAAGQHTDTATASGEYTDDNGDTTTPTDTDDANYFGFEPTGSIGDFVWEDLNYNGKQDANEPGIAGVTVNLLDTNGNVVKTTQTGSGNDLGKYLFGNVAPGDYSIQVVKPSNGYFFTKPNVPGDDALDSDVGDTGLTAIFNLSAGENDLTVDAGLYRKANLGDLVWLDRDNDGIQDSNERGVDKVIVKLLDASGAQVAMTTTDASGKYLFSNLDPGSYKLEFDKSLALTGAISVAKYPWSSKQNQGNDDGLDSDVAGSGFKATTALFTLESGENDLTQDAAITPIVIDLNGDGIKTIARADSQGTFDLLGTGSGINSGWLSGDDGFLVIDRNGNGSIDDISEMFGGSSKGDGFAKLASFDSNADGMVNANDADFAGLKIWRDVNGNHQTDDGELMSLADAGLVGLSISYSELPFLDAKGNLHLERGSATRADGSVVDMTDVYFNISASDAAAAGVQAPTLAELMGSDNSFDSLMTDVAAVAGQEPFDTAMGDAADSTNGGCAADWSGMNSMEVQLIGQAEASFSGVF